MISALVMLVIGIASVAMGTAGMTRGAASRVLLGIVLFFALAPGLAGSFRSTNLRAGFGLIAFSG